LKKTIRFGKSNGIKIFSSESDCSVHLQKLSVTHCVDAKTRARQDGLTTSYQCSQRFTDWLNICCHSRLLAMQHGAELFQSITA